MIPLNAMQKRIYMSEQFNDKNSYKKVNHYAISMQIDGKINETLLNKALQQLVQRHELLRSHIAIDHNNASPHFNSIPSADLSTNLLNIIEIMHADDPSLANLADTLKSINQSDIIHAPFDLKKNILWRNLLIKFSQEKYQLLFVFHHLIMDDTLQNTIIEELSEIYNALLENRQAPAPVTNHGEQIIKDFNNDLEKKLYWEQQLESLNILHLQSDISPKEAFRGAGNRLTFNLEPEQITALTNLASLYHVSLQSVFLATFFSLLFRYTAETDMTIGLTSTNPEIICKDKDKKKLFNCNTQHLPLRVQFEKKIFFSNLLHLIEQETNQGLKNELPLSALIKYLEPFQKKIKST